MDIEVILILIVDIFKDLFSDDLDEVLLEVIGKAVY